MAIENSVSKDFYSTFVDIIYVFDCRLSGVCMQFSICVLIFKGILCKWITSHKIATTFVNNIINSDQ